MKNQKHPLVSVIMTVYNGEAFLEQAIDSVLRQTLTDFEFIIVDDGSTDRTPEMLKNARKDTRVRVIAESRIGRAPALNRAWKTARGQFIANLDADDVAAPTRLERQVAFLQKYRNIGMLATDCEMVYSGYDVPEKSENATSDAILYSNDQLRRALVSHNPIHHSSVMMPRAALEAVGGYNDTLHIAIDYDLWVRIGAKYEMAVLNEKLTMRRVRKHSFFHKYTLIRERQKNTVKIRWFAWRHFSKKIGDLRFVVFEPLAKWAYIAIKYRLGLLKLERDKIMPKSKTKKIALFISSMHDGGAQRVFVKLARSLIHNYRIDMVLVNAEGPYLKEIPEGVTVHNLAAKRAVTCLPALLRYLKKERPDVLISALGYINILAILAKKLSRVPFKLIVTEHNTLTRAVTHAKDKRGKIMPRLMHWLYPQADKIVAVSDGVAEDMATAARLDRESIITAVNPIVTPEFEEMVNAAIDHPWLKPGQPPVFIGMGRLCEQKDFATLIQAIAKLRKKRPVRAIILGEGELRKSLKKLISELNLTDDVKLPGFVPNPFPYIANATGFVLSSKWEGLPSVLIEALYCGVPVISTQCPSGPDEILQNGRFGQLVPMEHPEALADAMEKVIAGNIVAAPTESWQPYTSEHAAQKYINLIEEISK